MAKEQNGRVTFERAALVDALSLVEPALHRSDTIAVMQCFCFHGDRVWAFNDRISIRTRLKHGLSCGVHGKRLLSILRLLTDESVSLEQTKNSLKIKCGAFSGELPIIESDKFLFDWKKIESGDYTKGMLAPEHIKAMEFALVSASDNAARLDMFGVMVTTTKNEMIFDSTDSYVLTEATAPLPNGLKKGLRFQCDVGWFDATIKAAKYIDNKGVELMVGADSAIIQTDSCDIMGSFIVHDTPMDYAKIINRYLEDVGNSDHPIPNDLPQAIERAKLFGDRCILSAEGGKLVLTSAGGAGRAVDAVPWEGEDGKDHKGAFNPEHMLKALDGMETITFSNKVVVLTKADADPYVIRLMSLVPVSDKDEVPF